MYIMCVTLCLFSALSCGVGALQISIIIIIKSNEVTEITFNTETLIVIHSTNTVPHGSQMESLRECNDRRWG